MQKYTQKAFSLVEMSVTLILVAVFTTGIIAGKSLLNSANVVIGRKLSKDFKAYIDNEIYKPTIWLDAADDSTVIRGSDGAVSEWRDKSGRRNHVSQDYNDARPKYVINGTNGLPVIDFDGTNDFLIKSDMSRDEFLSDDMKYTIFLVAKHNNNSLQADFSWNFGGSGNFRVIFTDYNIWFNGGGSLTYYYTDKEYLNAHIWTFQNESNVCSDICMYLDGNSSATGSGDGEIGDIVDDMFIGCVGTGYFVDGNIAELIIFDKALNDTDRVKVEKYLSAKWGIDLN